MQRREFHKATTGLILGTAIAAEWQQVARTFGATGRSASADEIGSNRFPRMVQEYFVKRVESILDARERRIMSLRTRRQAERYVLDVQAKIRTSFGPLPERTPLNDRVTSVVERDGYEVRNLIFESRPGFLVTGNLYMPTTDAGPFPGVVGTCGHSTNGKAAEAYQAFAQGLARKGYVVLLYDPIGQGERLQYTNEELKSTVGVGVREHLMAGNQQFLVGEFLGTWRAWDGIRALDYLQTLPEVDASQIGVTGNSGGGTMTTWLAGVENRWSMAAPSCFVTSFRNNLLNELPADTEQCPPNALGLGLDHEDFLAALAPRPVIILAKEKDFFDVRGSEGALRRLRHLYGLLLAESNVSLFTGPTTHGYSVENREAMYDWFNRATGNQSDSKEPKLTLEEDATLQCAPRGQVAASDSLTVMHFTAEKARELGSCREPKTDTELRNVLRKLIRTGIQNTVPDYRILRPHTDSAFPRKAVSSYFLEVEDNCGPIAYRLGTETLQSRPPQSESPAVLYVSHHSADLELREDWLKLVFEQHADAEWFACDVRGIGESRPNTCGRNSFLQPYGCDYFYAIHAIMLGDCYVGMKTRDVLATVRWLRSFGHQQVHLKASGWGTIPATFAAVLDPTISSLELIDSPDSFEEFAVSNEYDWPLSGFVPGILEHTDLPELYAHLQNQNRLQRHSQSAAKD